MASPLALNTHMDPSLALAKQPDTDTAHRNQIQPLRGASGARIPVWLLPDPWIRRPGEARTRERLILTERLGNCQTP